MISLYGRVMGRNPHQHVIVFNDGESVEEIEDALKKAQRDYPGYALDFRVIGYIFDDGRTYSDADAQRINELGDKYCRGE
jgi:hypothetical protein